MKCRKRIGDIQNRGREVAPGRAWREPADWPGGVRHEGGASAAQALVWNMGTCRLDTPAGRSGRQPGEGDPQAADLQGGCVPMRGTGADRLVVATMLGNAGGAKGAGHLGLLGGQPAPVVAGRSQVSE